MKLSLESNFFCHIFNLEHGEGGVIFYFSTTALISNLTHAMLKYCLKIGLKCETVKLNKLLAVFYKNLCCQPL